MTPTHIKTAPNAHPCVRLLMDAMNEKGVSLRGVARKSGVGYETLRAWQTRFMPRIDLLDAALNVVGLELHVRKSRARPKKRGIAVNWNTIIAAVAKERLISEDEFFGMGRQRHLVAARVDAIHRMKAAGMNGVAIARAVRRDHTTVCYWLRPGRRDLCLARNHVAYENRRRERLQAEATAPIIATRQDPLLTRLQSEARP